MKHDLNKKMTKGTIRTLSDFRCAMFRLLSELSFEDITVGEICIAANYPRATFYNYFEDKYDLLEYCFSWIISSLYIDNFKEEKSEDLLYLYFDRAFDFLTEHREVVEKILKSNGEEGYFSSSIHTYLQKVLRKIFQATNCNKSHGNIPKELLAEHYCNTIILLLKWSFLTRHKCTKEEAHNYIGMLLGGIK